MSPRLTPIERRLVAALDARAAQVTSADLRAPTPPTGSTPPTRWLVTIVGIAAALVAVACFVVLAQTPSKPGTTRPLAPGIPASAAVTGPPAAPTPIPSQTAAPAVSARSTSTTPGARPTEVNPPVAVSASP